MREVNLEIGYPVVAEAMRNLRQEIKNCKKREILLIIHGYGSSGKGGKIHDAARRWLKAQERNGILNAVISGEDFDMYNLKALELKNRSPGLKDFLNAGNCGITIVEK